MTGMAVTFRLRHASTHAMEYRTSIAAVQPRTKRRAGHGRWAILLLALLMLALCGHAHANCNNVQGNPHTAGTVSFTPPSTIMLPTNAPVGTILWTSSPVTPTNPPTLNCTGTTESGIVNQNAGQPTGGDDTLFPTNVSGLSYRLLHPDTSSILQAYPDETISSGEYQFSIATALELVVTGTIAPGSTLTGGRLARWRVNNTGNRNVAVINTTAITFTSPACNDPAVTVTLPTVLSSAFTGTGSTTGQTPFNIPLTCTAGANLDITLSTANPQSGTTGVIAPTTGSGNAGNVGVQLFDDSSCTSPVTFGTAISEGTTPDGAMNLPFCAQYYQTGTPVTAGNVTATATYTLTYP